MTSTVQTRNARLALAAAGGAVGASFGYSVGRLIKHDSIDLSDLRWSDTVTVFLGISMIAIGAIVALTTVVRRLSRQMIEPVTGRPITPTIARFYRLQAIVILPAGLMLVVPVLGVLEAGSEAVRSVLVVCVVILFAAQTCGNWLLWRRSHEFLRKVMADTGAFCFWLLQGALFLWAAGERMPWQSSWSCTRQRRPASRCDAACAEEYLCRYFGG